ncbi:DEAD/DEAH box helicase family protein [Emticicia agri]|uniref:DEAD/DEAH box helicase n=1 Tax=Emticicia agri TaxID=2492393 RepID=A0A4Q5LR26_9BACT|nr:DEAD/DEAH box helicase family protein [Emticicia agri]RYU91803.1 DEAD/DEAH box helicase [Emticicia agri]
MLKDINWSEDRAYFTFDDNVPTQFYIDCLSNSKTFDLLLGYFSSAAINVLSLGFATFLSSGGTMRIIINNVLSEEDKNAIKRGEEKNINKDLIDLSDIENLKQRLNEYGVHFFECLSWLIANNKIQIKIIRPKSGRGISHYKDGIFSDGENSIGFNGSCNFTAYGLLENLESIQCFLSWENGRSNKMINSLKNRIDTIFSESSSYVEYLDVNEVIIAIKNEFGNKNINELIIKEKELIKKKAELLNNVNLNASIKKVNENLEMLEQQPRFPFSEGPRPYQIEAYKNWVKNDRKGLFAMATGTGKTITALNCLLEEFRKNKNYYAIILVPSKALLEQWINEVEQFNFSNLIVIGGGYDGMKYIPNYVSNFKAGLRKNGIIISTYASFSSDRFIRYFSKIQDNFILIADEAHNMGANQIKDIISVLTIPKRIGLSATPNRKYDPDGTDAICDFFNDQPPFCYSFGMRRAMKEGRLTDYFYYPKIVNLEEDEKEDYIELSNKLLKFFDFEQGKFKDSPIVESLLLRRKTIIHQARRKISAYKGILKELDRKDKLRYVFTYVPVGSSREEEVSSEDDANKFVYQYLRAAQEVKPNLRASTYTSETEERNNKLRGFSEGKIDMLLAMKMLDEGVDIPRTEVGIFASSTGNPREYIQRRGRLLRNHVDKKFAYIYDMIVAPVASHDNENLYRIERNMVKNELIRVAYFASLSMNFYDSKDALQDICDRYELDLDMIINTLEND